jgi:hypothetical protein
MIILENAGKIGFEYMLVHSSESVPFIFLNRELQPTDLVDPWGNRLGEFIQEFEKIFKEDFYQDKGWIWKQDEVWLDLLHDNIEGYLIRLANDRKLGIEELTRRGVVTKRMGIIQKEKERAEIARLGKTPTEITEEEGRKIQEKAKVSEEEVKLTDDDYDEIKRETNILWNEEKKKFEKLQLEQLWDYFKRLIQSRTLSYGPEKIAYYVVGKWMQQNNDPLWMPIIDKTIEYYAKKEKKEPEQWLKDKNIKEKNLEDLVFKKDYRLWVPSVSAKYVWGHFNPEKNPITNSSDNAISGMVERDPKKLLDKHKIYFIIETPMAGAGMEDLLRFPQPAQMYYLIKEMNSPWFGIAVDIEHMLMDGLNVEVAIEVIPPEAGKYVRVLHCGWPSPLGPAHIPIPLGSEQQFYLYKTYWNLKQKGMSKDPKDNVYMIFERGGGGDPIQQSILALRAIKEFLEKDVPPDKLPLEFWGLDTGQWASIDRQLATIREHAWDPLKGLLQVPEEEHGLYGRSAVEKGKGEEWKKEKFR